MKLEDLSLIVYDCEVIAHDFMVDFKSFGGEHVSLWNDGRAIRDFIEDNDEAVFVGFNNKHYDQHIVKAICVGCEPEEVKEINDWIIAGGTPWEHPFLRDARFWFSNTDLMDDMQKGMSLKAIEGHLGMSIVESSVPFDIQTKLTPEQRDEVTRYCRYDVDATEELLKLRWDYLQTKMHLAELGGINQKKALSKTDPMLAAEYMQAKRIPHIEDKERDYAFPERLDYSYIPDDIIEFFKQIWDESIPLEELFKTSFDCEIGGCPVRYAWGGAHGALPKYKERATCF